MKITYEGSGKQPINDLLLIKGGLLLFGSACTADYRHAITDSLVLKSLAYNLPLVAEVVNKTPTF